MYIKQDFDFEDLKKNCWSEALKTLQKIEFSGKEDLFMDILPDFFGEEIPTLTEVNDLLWFNNEDIYEALEMEVN